MKIDYSQIAAFQFCPGLYEEKYVYGIEKDWAKLGYPGGRMLGKRVHQLIATHYDSTREATPPEGLLPEVEQEAQWMLAGYKAHYPQEPFEIIELERTFEIPLGDSQHTLTGKRDAVVRDLESGMLEVFETKTEKRGSKANDPEAWASRMQVGLYLYAAQRLYCEEFKDILLNICTRPSPKGQEPPTFSRQKLQRASGQIAEAVETAIYVANQITSLKKTHVESAWPRNRENCKVDGWKRCDYFDLHLYGRSRELLERFKLTEPYLEI